MADRPRLRQIDLFETLPDPPVQNEAPAARIQEPTRTSAPNRKRSEPEGRASQPSAPRFQFKLRYLVLVLLAGAAATVWSWYYSRMTTIETVSVSNHYFTDEDDIVRKSGVITGIAADSLVYSDVIRRIETLPYVRQARIVQVPPTGIVIRVEERRPVGLIAQINRYVDRDGVLLPVIPGKALEVPLLYGLSVPTGADTLKGASFAAMGSFLEALDRFDVAKITVSDVGWEPGTGIVAASSDYGTRLIFGTGGFDEKLKAWQAFYTQVVPKAGLNTFAKIDLRYRGQIVTEPSASSL